MTNLDKLHLIETTVVPDGDTYLFKVYADGNLYKSMRYATKEEAKQAEQRFGEKLSAQMKYTAGLDQGLDGKPH